MADNSSQPAVSVDPGDNILSALYERARTNGADTALLHRVGDDFAPVTTAEMLATVRELGAGLIGAGVEAGDRVAIFSKARLEWPLLDYAIWQAGAVGVTIYETSSALQVEWILSDSGATAVVVENAELQEILDEVRPGLTDLREVFLIEDDGLKVLRDAGSDVTDEQLDERAATIQHDQPATLVYTSGTTGRPKGCVLTHLNLIWTIRQVMVDTPELVAPGNRTLSFLPLAHILARVVGLTAVTAGVPVAFGGGIRTLLTDLADVKPTWLVVVPRVLEKVHDGAQQKAGTGVKHHIFEQAAEVARQMGGHQMAGTEPPWHLRLRHKAADAVVYGSLRAAMGGELNFVISGGAPLHEDLARFFNGVGVEVLEGYGLTETTGPATVHRIGASKPGTVGPPLAGVDIRIDESGEILLSGPLVFEGYWQNEEATAEVFDGAWLRTGDIGELDADGHLVITGRMKDLIVTAGGKNVAPAVLEMGLASHQLVSHAVVVGNDRPFISALITLDIQSLGNWANAHDRHVSSPGRLVEELAADPELHAELQSAVDATNEQVSRAEGIRSFRVLQSDFTVASGELTPSMKVRRSTVISNHSTLIERIYDTPRK